MLAFTTISHSSRGATLLAAALLAMGSAAMAQPPRPTAKPSSAPAAKQGLAIESRSAFMARCRDETLRDFPNTLDVDGACHTYWEGLLAAEPFEQAVAAVIRTRTNKPVRTVDDAKMLVPGVRWDKEKHWRGVASGKLGTLRVVIPERFDRVLDRIELEAGGTGGLENWPDLIARYRSAGVKAVEVGCTKDIPMMPGRVRDWRITPPSAQTFTIQVAETAAAFGNQYGGYSVGVYFNETLASAAIRAREESCGEEV